MKHKKFIALLLTLALLLPCFAMPASADPAYGYDVSVTPEEVTVGQSTEVIVSLTGYTEAAAAAVGIRGVQVDITNVDTDVLTVESYESLIEDATALSNTASHQPNKKLVRLLYTKMSGTLAAPCDDILKVVFQINPNLTEDGSITLPITVKIRTDASNSSDELNGSITISYTAAAAAVTSVDIEWGAMSFTYTDGPWDPNTHSYAAGQWTDNGTGYVTVRNTGTEDVSVKTIFAASYTGIGGSFTCSGAALNDALPVAAGEDATVWLALSGRPGGALNNQKLGTVTVELLGGE